MKNIYKSIWRCQTNPNTSQSVFITQTYEAQIWNYFVSAVQGFAYKSVCFKIFE